MDKTRAGFQPFLFCCGFWEGFFCVLLFVCFGLDRGAGGMCFFVQTFFVGIFLIVCCFFYAVFC